MQYTKFLFLFLCSVCIAAHTKITPVKTAENKDFLLRADQVSHEKDLGLIIARGHVKISDGVEIIEADMVSYNQKLKTFSASGHVKYYDKKGSLIRANYMEIGDSFKKGFVEKARILTEDGQRISAQTGEMSESISNFSNVSYTPCKVCAKKPPTWTIQASKIKKDDKKKMVYYYNSILRIKNVPVMYTPYFSHPDPAIKRQNGFLMPTIGSSSALGGFVGIPYYISPNAQEELTIKPYVMSKNKGPLLGLDYARFFDRSSARITSSMTQTNNVSRFGAKQKNRIHGHIFADWNFDINDNWRAKSEIRRASSPTYLKKYYFLEGPEYRTQNYLTSSVRLEHFDGPNYTSFQGLDFQNLNNQHGRETAPFVLPMVEGSYMAAQPGAYGERPFIEFNQAYVSRDRGSRVGRTTVIPGVSWLKTTASGLINEIKIMLRGDLYDIKKYQPTAHSGHVNQGLGRTFPTVSWTSRLPLMRQSKDRKWVLTPIWGGVAMPRGLNKLAIPNNDSEDFEFDTTNLFSVNRFSGFDRVDDGHRLNYGFVGEVFDETVKKIKIMLGQSYSFTKTSYFGPYSGIRKGASDYVGLLNWEYSELFSVKWHFRMANKFLKIKRNTLTLNAGPEVFNVALNYTHHNHLHIDDHFVKSEQVGARISSKFHKNWTTFIHNTREFGYKKGELQHGGGLIFQDDCFKAKFDFFRTFYKDRDILPSSTFMLTLGFKNLGEYSTGALNFSNPGQASLPNEKD